MNKEKTHMGIAPIVDDIKKLEIAPVMLSNKRAWIPRLNNDRKGQKSKNGKDGVGLWGKREDVSEKEDVTKDDLYNMYRQFKDHKKNVNAKQTTK